MIRFLVVLCLLALQLTAAAATVTVPSNLKAEAVPAIPEKLMEELERYNSYRTAEFQDWHPLRREILITTRFGEVPQIHQVTQPGGARTQLTFFPESVEAGRYNPATGETFVYSKDIGGGEFYQLCLHEMKTGRSTLLTDGKSRNTFGGWSPDGKLIAYSSTRRNGKDSDIYVMDPSDPKSARILLEVDSVGWGVEDWAPDSSRLIVERYKSADSNELYEVDIKTGQKRAITPQQPGISFFYARYAGDGKGFYAATNQSSDFRQLAYVDLSSGKATVLRPDLSWDIAGIAVSKNGRRLAYTVNEGGAEKLHAMETATRKELNVPRLPQGTFDRFEWHSNSKDLAFSMASATSPSDVHSIDMETGQLERWTMSETGGLDAGEFVEPELIRWKSFDGLSISGFYYKPPARFTGPRPVIVDIHGGPESQYQPGYLGRSNYFLTELGIAIIKPNVRGSSGYGKRFMNLDNAMKREDSVKDIGALLDWIGQQKDLDPERVMVMGGSYGGYMTLAAMTHYNDRFRCAVDVVGISNFVTFLERTEAYRRDLRRAEYGDERDPKLRDFLSTISPVNSVRKITKPMFIIQGKNDPRVPYTESEQMVEAIRKNGGPVWYLLAEDEGHGFAKKGNRDYQFAATVLIIQKHLLPEASSQTGAAGR